MAHIQQLAGHAGVTQMHAPLQQTYCSSQMTSDVTYAIQDCVCYADNLFCLRKQATHLKLFPGFEPLEFVAIAALGPLPKIQRGFQYIIGIADRFIKQVQVVPFRRIRSTDVIEAFLEQCFFMYEPPKTQLSDSEKTFTFISRRVHSSRSRLLV